MALQYSGLLAQRASLPIGDAFRLFQGSVGALREFRSNGPKPGSLSQQRKLP